MIGMILGGICLVYFAALVFIGMDFSLIWLIGGILLFGLGAFSHFGKWTPSGGLCVGLGAAAGICLLLFLGVEALIFTGMFAKGEPDLEYLVILGAQVRGKEPSRALKKRLDKAYEYLMENPDTQAVVSGGMGTGEEITEAGAMKDYLCRKGIDEGRILLEDRSTSTVENLSFTAELIDKEARIGLVTSNFHVYRSLRLAKKQGYTNVCGIAAPSDMVWQLHYLVREFFALVKEWILKNI